MVESENVPQPPLTLRQRADSFLKKLMDATENLVNLQIATIVGDVELSGQINHPRIKFAGNNANRESVNVTSVIVTNVNLVDSDITTVIPPKYEKNINSPIMKYHDAQVAQANQSMDKKLELIQALITDIVPNFRSTPPNH